MRAVDLSRDRCCVVAVSLRSCCASVSRSCKLVKLCKLSKLCINTISMIVTWMRNGCTSRAIGSCRGHAHRATEKQSSSRGSWLRVCSQKIIWICYTHRSMLHYLYYKNINDLCSWVDFEVSAFQWFKFCQSGPCSSIWLLKCNIGFVIFAFLGIIHDARL